MAKRGADEIDIACQQWAKVRRALLGLDDPRMERAQAREFLGAIRSTLGQRRDLHAGATSGKVEQHYPEVFTGTALAVNRAYHHMPAMPRKLLDVHYVARAPVVDKAEVLAMDVVTYYRHLNHAKGIVYGWLMRDDGFDNYENAV
jgi:hypothetical protein